MKEPYSTLLSFVSSEGYSLASQFDVLAGNDSIQYWGLPKKASLQFVSLCERYLVPILGGDVVFTTEDGLIHYTGDNWYSNRQDGEDYGTFAKRSYSESYRFINSYPEFTKDYKPFFFIFVVEEPYSEL